MYNFYCRISHRKHLKFFPMSTVQNWSATSITSGNNSFLCTKCDKVQFEGFDPSTGETYGIKHFFTEIPLLFLYAVLIFECALIVFAVMDIIYFNVTGVRLLPSELLPSEPPQS